MTNTFFYTVTHAAAASHSPSPNICACVCLCRCLCRYMQEVGMHARMVICMYACVCMQVWMYVRTYVCMYIVLWFWALFSCLLQTLTDLCLLVRRLNIRRSKGELSNEFECACLYAYPRVQPQAKEEILSKSSVSNRRLDTHIGLVGVCGDIHCSACQIQFRGVFESADALLNPKPLL